MRSWTARVSSILFYHEFSMILGIILDFTYFRAGSSNPKSYAYATKMKNHLDDSSLLRVDVTSTNTLSNLGAFCETSGLIDLSVSIVF